MIIAGFARVDVTPPLGNVLSGYFEKRSSVGVLDPLELNAVCFGNENEQSLIIACDFTGMSMTCSEEVRALISARTGIAQERIMLCSMHQHTSYRVGGLMRIASGIQDETFMDVLYRKFCDVAQMALADASGATLGSAKRDSLVPLSFIRRYIMEDGSIKTNPCEEEDGKPVDYCSQADNAVRLLRFKRNGKKDIALVSFSTHADVIGGCLYSADWPGFVRRTVESDNLNTHCVCIVGCQGDSNHIDFLKPLETRPPKKDYEFSRHMGRVIADTVKEMWEHTTPHTEETVYGGIKNAYNKTNTEGEERFDEYVRIYEDVVSGKKTVDWDIYPRIRRIASLRNMPQYQTVPVTVLGFGDIAFVGFGGEPLTHYTFATEALPILKDKTVFCVALANGNEGYLITDVAFDEGAYEANNTYFTKGLESACVSIAEELLTEFYDNEQ